MMKLRQTIFILLSFFAASVAKAQDRYFTKTGTIRFFSATDLENIEATNKIVTAVLD
ncbi:MAG: YceI family protein, partial [Sphingobacteriales bacterium]